MCGISFLAHRWLSVIIYVVFLFLVITVLLNLLIAQMSDTYSNVQSDAQRSLVINRAWIVARVEHMTLSLLCISHRTISGRLLLWIKLVKDSEANEATRRWYSSEVSHCDGILQIDYSILIQLVTKVQIEQSKYLLVRVEKDSGYYIFSVVSCQAVSFKVWKLAKSYQRMYEKYNYM